MIFFVVYYYLHLIVRGKHGGVAQLARANGSYPLGRWFKPTRRYHIRPLGQAVKTSPFHGGNTSSILVGVTRKKRLVSTSRFFNELPCGTN